MLKFKINNERLGIIILHKNSYRAYWLRYSNGLIYPYKLLLNNLWCFPRLERIYVKFNDGINVLTL
jgi:hypothetical protein